MKQDLSLAFHLQLEEVLILQRCSDRERKRVREREKERESERQRERETERDKREGPYNIKDKQ